MGFTNETVEKILNHVTRNIPYESPEKVYVGLFVADEEVDGAGYERREITFSAPQNGVITNENELRFPIAHDEWGEIAYAAVFDSETGGNRLFNSRISQVRLVRENDQFTIPVGNLEFELE